MKPLTDSQRAALRKCSRRAGATVAADTFKRLSKTQISQPMRDKLQARGLIELRSGTYRITQAGQAALDAPVPKDPLLLAANSQYGYTTNPALAMRDEMPPLGEPSESWKEAERTARAEAKTSTREGKRREARKLANLAKQSGRHGWRTTGPTGPVKRRIDPSVIRPNEEAA